jgi:Zn-dependent peptidase ImmA (M78 family)
MNALAWLKSLPDSIRVGSFDIALRVRKLDSAKFLGTYSATKAAIELNPGHPNVQSAVDTLLHELGHAIFDLYGLDGDTDTEERIVATQAKAWVGIIRDNPWLLDKLKEALT